MTGSEPRPQISVYAGKKQVGSLIFEQPKICLFEYTASWIAEGYPVSPHIPFEGEIPANTVVNFIRNLFPEGSAFELLLESEHLSKNNLYAILTAIGRDTAGALTFGAGQRPQTALREVTDSELTKRLDGNTDVALWDGKFRLSVAGVQNKLNVYVDVHGALFLADGKYASTHILKFSSPDYPSVVINELYCMTLAGAVGLTVPKVSVRNFGTHSALLVQRFDRRITEQGVDKRHMIDGCQALDFPPEYKYEQNFGSGRDVAHIRDGVNLARLFEFAKTTSVPAVTTQSIIDWVLFNLIIGNSDAHGKNISFFVTASGGLSITPFYDLVSVVFEASQQPKLDTRLAMAIGDNFDINKTTAYDLLSMAEDAQIKFSLLKRRLDSLALRCRNQARRLDMSGHPLSKEQNAQVDALSQLVVQRCDYLLEQSRQFSPVRRAAFD